MDRQNEAKKFARTVGYIFYVLNAAESALKRKFGAMINLADPKLVKLLKEAGEEAASKVLEKVFSGELSFSRWLRPKHAALYVNISERELERRRKTGLPPPYRRISEKVVIYDTRSLDRLVLSSEQENDFPDEDTDEDGGEQ